MHSAVLLLASLALAFVPSSVVAQVDIVVGPTGYASLDDALAAANDGDRILLRSDTEIQTTTHHFAFHWAGTNLRIESDPAGPIRTIRLYDLANDIPISLHLSLAGTVVLRNLRIETASVDVAGQSMTSSVRVAADHVIMESVELNASLHFTDGPIFPALDVLGRRVWMSRVSVVVGMASSSSWFQAGTMHGVSIRASESVLIEDSVFIGGDGPLSADCTAPTDGGAGLLLRSPHACMVRSVVRDGNGGTWQCWWPDPEATYYTAPGVSSFGPGLVAFESTWYEGFSYESATGSGPPIQLGHPDSLIDVSSAPLGGSISITVRRPAPPTPEAIGFLVGLGTMTFASPLGTLFVRPDISYPVSAQTASAAIVIHVPQDAALLGTTVFAQTVLRGIRLGDVGWGIVSR